MKRLALVIILAFSTQLANAQTKDGELNRRLAAFIQATKAMEISKILDYTYPRLFELKSKQAALKELTAAFNSPLIRFSMDVIKVLAVDDISDTASTKFTRLSYEATANMRLTANNYSEQKIASYLEGLKSQYGEENVTYNAATNSFRVNITKEALAIKDKYSKGKWTFIELNLGNNVLHKVLPSFIITKYKI